MLINVNAQRFTKVSETHLKPVCIHRPRERYDDCDGDALVS